MVEGITQLNLCFLTNSGLHAAVPDIMAVHGFAEVEVLQHWIDGRKVVLRRIAHQLTRIGNIEPLEAVVAKSVEDRELQILNGNATVD